MCSLGSWWSATHEGSFSSPRPHASLLTSFPPWHQATSPPTPQSPAERLLKSWEEALFCNGAAHGRGAALGSFGPVSDTSHSLG